MWVVHTKLSENGLIPRVSPRPMKNKNRRGEPGIDLHVISRHDTFALTITCWVLRSIPSLVFEPCRGVTDAVTAHLFQ